MIHSEKKIFLESLKAIQNQGMDVFEDWTRMLRLKFDELAIGSGMEIRANDFFRDSFKKAIFQFVDLRIIFEDFITKGKTPT